MDCIKIARKQKVNRRTLAMLADRLADESILFSMRAGLACYELVLQR